MSVRTIQLSALAAVFAATLLLPRIGPAQVRTKSAPAASPALALETRARSLMDQPKKWTELARLMAEASQIRSADDPRGVDDLVLAAAAYRWSGKRTLARTTYVSAAERALSLGDVVRAADAFLCAAIIANEQKNLAEAWELKARAERLAQSPLLTDGQRRSILSQFATAVRYGQYR